MQAEKPTPPPTSQAIVLDAQRRHGTHTTHHSWLNDTRQTQRTCSRPALLSNQRCSSGVLEGRHPGGVHTTGRRGVASIVRALQWDATQQIPPHSSQLSANQPSKQASSVPLRRPPPARTHTRTHTPHDDLPESRARDTARLRTTASVLRCTVIPSLPASRAAVPPSRRRHAGPSRRLREGTPSRAV